MSNTVSKTAYGYDGFGRITGSAQTTPANATTSYTFTYAYSLTDTLTSITYPSNRQVIYALDAGDRVTAVQNVTGGGYYASGIGYTADDGLNTLPLGNTVTENYSWNDRFQPTGMTAKQGGSTVLGLGLYPCPSNAPACASGNNGNLLSQTITIPGLSLTQSYTYDHLNRLTGAQETGGGANWSQSYGYDPVGNRWVSANSGLPTLTPETPIAPTWYSSWTPPTGCAPWHANQINGWCYDANGNVLQVGSMARSFTYDAENRQVTATIASATSSYAYDGEGQRVQKTVGGQTTTYVYDAFGNLAAEYGPGSPSPCGTPTCYVTTDHLGSTRLLTSSAGAVGARYDYEPFGQEIGANYDGRTTALGFMTPPDGTYPMYTGQYRDVETHDTNGGSLDWFNARYYSGAQGRFQSPDPANAGADPSNPQSWNGYSYVTNNPLSITDPSGLGFWSDLIGAAGFASKIAGEILTLGFGGFFAGEALSGVLATGASDAVWSEEIPAGVDWSGTLATGDVFGTGNTGPFIFSLSPDESVLLGGGRIGSLSTWLSPLFPKIRSKGQTFSACMAQHAGEYSIAGMASAAYEAKFGKPVPAWAQAGLSFAYANPVSLLYSGSTTDAAEAMGSTAPELLRNAMGNVTSYGRRTSTLQALNLAGKGGVPLALGRTGMGIRTLLDQGAHVLGGGLNIAQGLTVGAGFSVGEAINCR